MAPCVFSVCGGLHEPPGLMCEYSLPIIQVHLVISDLSLSLYRMLAELFNSRYLDGKRVLNNGIHTSIVVSVTWGTEPTSMVTVALSNE